MDPAEMDERMELTPQSRLENPNLSRSVYRLGLAPAQEIILRTRSDLHPNRQSKKRWHRDQRQVVQKNINAMIKPSDVMNYAVVIERIYESFILMHDEWSMRNFSH